MHGLGNDFVVMDGRRTPVTFDEATAAAVADRKRGIGCDQFIGLSASSTADVQMHIYNADGGRVAACGNATRCIGQVLLSETGAEEVTIQTDAGVLKARSSGVNVSVDMGRPGLNWHDIPLAEAQDTLHLPIGLGPLTDPVAVSMGNPHMVFFVSDIQDIDMVKLGAELEHHALYPERANVGVAQIIDEQVIRLRVWERGVGLTQACGTGACAALVAAFRRGLSDRKARLDLDGGALQIDWAEDDHVWMTGSTTLAYEGQVDLTALRAQVP